MPEYSPFERRRRLVARVSLYGSVLLVGLATFGFWAVITRPFPSAGDVSWYEIAWENEPAVRLLQQYLRIDTGPAGNELAGALFLSTPLRAAGIATEIVTLGRDRANLRAVLPGDDDEQLVLLSHLDVEPIGDPRDWERPPFSGVLAGPMIWGRGAFDMKSYTVAQLWALLELGSGDTPPARTVTLLATSGEERGSHLGLRWLLWQRPGWFDDVWAVLTEGGLLEARSLEEPKYWAIEIGQKTVVTFEACAASRERLEALRADVRGILRGRRAHPVRVTDPVRGFWREYWPTRDRTELREILEDPLDLERDYVAARRLPPYLLRLVTDELGVGAVEPAPGGGWRVPLSLVLLPGTQIEDAIERFFPPWLTGGVTLTRTETEDLGGMSPTTHPAFRVVAERLRRSHPEAPVGPFVLPATMTDARFLRARGIPAYGVTPFYMLTPETLRAANPNEKIPAPALVEGAALYADLVAALAN